MIQDKSTSSMIPNEDENRYHDLGYIMQQLKPFIDLVFDISEIIKNKSVIENEVAGARTYILKKHIASKEKYIDYLISENKCTDISPEEKEKNKIRIEKILCL